MSSGSANNPLRGQRESDHHTGDFGSRDKEIQHPASCAGLIEALQCLAGPPFNHQSRYIANRYVIVGNFRRREVHVFVVKEMCSLSVWRRHSVECSILKERKRRRCVSHVVQTRNRTCVTRCCGQLQCQLKSAMFVDRRGGREGKKSLQKRKKASCISLCLGAVVFHFLTYALCRKSTRNRKRQPGHISSRSSAQNVPFRHPLSAMAF